MEGINIKKEIRTAFKQGDSERIKTLIGNDEEILNLVTAFGTWLHVASDFGNLEIVKYLVEKGLDVNVEGGIAECGSIKTASSEGHIEIVKYLLDKGVNFDVSDPTKNPLFGAITGGHKDIVEFLIDSDIDISVKYSGDYKQNMDALAYAIEIGQTDIANYLKELL